MGIAIAHDAIATEAATGAEPGVGAAIGTIERTYGLLTCEEIVRVVETIDRSGDLAVADRIGFLCATRMRTQVAVFEHDGWFYVGMLDRFISAEQAASLRCLGGSPRLLSIVDSRGITPIVGPLAGE